MTGNYTRRQHFHSPLARENISAHSCNIQPYFTFTHAIMGYLYRRVHVRIKRPPQIQCTHHSLVLTSCNSFTKMLLKWVKPLNPIRFSHDYILTASPPMDKASLRRCVQYSRGFTIVGPRSARTDSRRGLWKASQPEILLSLVAMPSSILTFWWNW